MQAQDKRPADLYSEIKPETRKRINLQIFISCINRVLPIEKNVNLSEINQKQKKLLVKQV